MRANYQMLGVIGAARVPKRNVRPTLAHPPDVFQHPDKVVACPYGGACMTFSSVAQVAVSGGKSWVPQWAQSDTEYDGPVTAAIRLDDGTIKKFDNLQSLTVSGGTRQILGAGFSLPSLHLDPNLQSSLSAPALKMTPEQLANLDRALTSEEQKIVDAWQSAQADAMQRKEESQPFVNPTTGKLTKVSTTFQAGTAKEKPWVGLLIVGGVAIIGLGATIYLLAKAKWGWAIVNFFIITPAVTTAVAAGYVALAAKGKA